MSTDDQIVFAEPVIISDQNIQEEIHNKLSNDELKNLDELERQIKNGDDYKEFLEELPTEEEQKEFVSDVIQLIKHIRRYDDWYKVEPSENDK